VTETSAREDFIELCWRGNFKTNTHTHTHTHTL